MGVSTFQLLKMVAPIILFTLILGTVDVWTDANLIVNLFTGEAECLVKANVELCNQVGADVFCNSSEYNSSIFDHSICPFGGQYLVDNICYFNIKDGATEKWTGNHYKNCVDDPLAYCREPDTKHNIVCSHSNHPVFGGMLAGKYLLKSGRIHCSLERYLPLSNC